jgi:hypothetical protein
MEGRKLDRAMIQSADLLEDCERFRVPHSVATDTVLVFTVRQGGFVTDMQPRHLVVFVGVSARYTVEPADHRPWLFPSGVEQELNLGTNVGFGLRD